jgi:Protein of unknown function (DUF3014)
MNNGVRTEPKLQELPGEDLPPGEPQSDQAPMRKSRRRRRHLLRWVLPLIALLAIAAFLSVVMRPGPREPAPAAPAATPPRAQVEPPAAPRYPIETVAGALPPLDASDAVLVSALQALFADGGGVMSFLEPRDLVRNFVATVDNLPRRTIPPQRVPLKQPAGAFSAVRADDAAVIGTANASRYRPYVALLEQADMTKVAQLYVRNYALFQQAYRDLGYPNGHFNDRLVEAIDVVLATPDPSGAIKLVQPKIFYQYADQSLEALPAGQKLMLRMGADNAAKVKSRLVELRALVTAQPAAR